MNIFWHNGGRASGARPTSSCMHSAVQLKRHSFALPSATGTLHNTCYKLHIVNNAGDDEYWTDLSDLQLPLWSIANPRYFHANST